MKKYKPLTYLPLYLLFSVSQPAHATLWEKAERLLDNKYVRGALRSIPYVGDAFSVLAEERLESKVDHIKSVQNTGLDQLRELARKALQTKEKVEEMYYLGEQSKRMAEELMRSLQSGKPQDVLGALVEKWIGIPINPADYIPDTPHSRALRENLAWDLASGHGLIQQYAYLLQGTRAALLAQEDLLKQDPEQFNQAYEKAVRYEQELAKALSAKKKATIRLYKEDIASLEKEIQALEKAKQQEGLTMGDLMQIEIAIDNKKHIIRELHEKITEGIEKEMQLTEEQEAQLYEQKAAKDAEHMRTWKSKERTRLHRKYGHLWKFW